MLPERWAIEITKDNLQLVGGYYDKKTNTSMYTTPNRVGKLFLSHNGVGEYIGSKNKVRTSFITNWNDIPDKTVPIISTEQFIKYVINKEEYKIYELWI